MSAGHKRILSPFAVSKKRKAWINTREKYMPEERRKHLAETDRGSFYNQDECVEEFLDDRGAFYNGNESDDGDIANFTAACSFIKNRPQHMCFPMKFVNFLRTPFS